MAFPLPPNMFILATLMHGSISDNGLHHSGEIKYPRNLILIWDMGASYKLIPFIIDFIDYVKCNIPVKYGTKINRFIVIGTIFHKFISSNGKEVFLPCMSYHLTQTYFQLFSPQNYHHMHGSYSEVHDFRVSMYLTDYRINITIYI